MNSPLQPRILLVDDQPADLAALRALLDGVDATLVAAGSAKAALAALLEGTYALVLIEVRTPALEGLRTAELIRGEPPGAGVPTIFLGDAAPGAAVLERAYALGAADYLVRPVHEAALRAKARVFVDLQRRNAELARLAEQREQRHRCGFARVLASRDERLRLILDNLHEYAFIGTDSERRITEWEAGAEAILGWRAHDAIGQRADMLFVPEDRAAGQPEREAARARETGRAADRRWHLRADGSRFFAGGVTIPLREHGVLRGYAKIMRDATHEHIAAEKLVASERALGASTDRLTLLLDSSGEGILGLDADACCTFLNSAGAAMLGYTQAELIGRRVTDLLAPGADGTAVAPGSAPAHALSAGSIDAVADAVTDAVTDAVADELPDAVRAGQALRRDDVLLRRKDGSLLPVAYSLHPMAGGAGRPGAVLTFADVSARHQAEAERARLYAQLRVAHERMRDIVDRAPAFMAVMRGPDLVFELANERFADLVGRRPLLGRPLRTALPEMAGQGFCELLEEVYRSGEAHEGNNVRLLLLSDAQGAGQEGSAEAALEVPAETALETYYVDFVYLALREADGTVSGVLVHGVDVTERARANLLALGQRGALELAVSNAPLGDVLDLLVRTAEEYTGGCALAGIQLVEGERLRHAAAPSLPPALVEMLDGVGMAPLGAAGGTAAWRAEAVASGDIARDPVWERCRAPALAAGLRASRALPVLSPGGAVLGAFAWYYREGTQCGSRDDAAMSLLANTASLVIGQRHEAAGRAAAEERSHAILESMSDGFLALDHGWRIAYANGAAERLTGHAREDLLGAVFWDLFPEWIGSEQELACRRCRVDRIAARVEAWLPAWGRWYEINCFATPGGGIALYLRDQSERRQAEEGVRRLAAVTEQSSDFIGLFAADGAGLYLNLAGRALAGIDAEDDIRGARLLDFFADECRDYVHAEVLPALNGAQGRWEGELRFRRPAAGQAGSDIQGAAAEPTPVYFKGFAVHGTDGSHLGLATITRDITEQKRAEDELRRIAADLSEADHRKSEFLATLAHELRNPLAPIRTGLDLMRMAPGDPRTAARVHEMMDRQLGHLIHLVDDLLDIARITRGRIELKKEALDLRTAVSMAVETSTALMEAAGHRLAVELPDAPLPLDGDLTRLVQVLSNLLNNAAKYTPGGGQIRLAAWRENGKALVAVTDSGIGIAPEAIGSVFEMFTQVRSSLDRAQGGLGIGLSLVRRLVELHGGRVQAESAGRGQGSTFTVRLPLRRQPATVQDGARHAPVQAPRHGLRVLVVDDNLDAAESLVALLGALGHQTRMAHDGPAGLAAARAFRPDLALLDIGLPGMNGHELARAIRAQPGLRATTLIALTGWGAASDMTLSQQAGFDQHLTKPVSLETLEQALCTATAVIDARREHEGPGDKRLDDKGPADERP